MSDAALALVDIRRGFGSGPTRLEVLKGVDLTIEPGQIVALVGPSGAGKSTLLQIAGLLEMADAGRVMIAGRDCSVMNDAGRTQVRRETVGFVYQFHHLLPEFSALENVMLPQRIGGASRAAATARARELLTRLGLAERETHRPAELSGGEQQRVAIARAVANRPRLLLADEPTGNLDPETADRVFAEFLHLVRSEGVGALIATHNHDLARRMDRAITMRDGRIIELQRRSAQMRQSGEEHAPEDHAN